MSSDRFALPFLALFMTGSALAEPPRVVADIAPVHSLVASVMQGVATPALIVQSGASPHEYSLRPSEAAALQEAELVFWMGAELTPWLDGAIETLTDDATVVTLLERDGTRLLPFRESALFEAHDHAGGDHEEREHEAHAHHEHDHEHDHDHDHDHDHETEHDHVHGESDPHAWLSPDNARNWLDLIARELSGVDPENASTYEANALTAIAGIDAVEAEVTALLDPVRGSRYIVFHDAYQYFEEAFDFSASGAIALSDAADPSPARIAGIQARIADQNIACVLSEPQFNPGIIATVMAGSDARTAVLDPLGSDLTPGPALYPQMLRRLAQSLVDCF